MASGGVEMNDSERIAGVTMSFPATDSSSPSKLPRRLRQRLLVESKAPSTVEEIDAKLKEADLRRQQFYQSLSSKARQKPRLPWSSSQESELGQRLEAKLNAAEQKRLNIIAKAQMRLSKLDELRRAARSEADMRSEKERDELGMKVESQIQQAEMNRMLIQKTNRQLMEERKERATQSLMRRIMQESRYKECVHAAIQQKRLAAERKRLGFLEAERSKARARLLRVQRVANLVSTQREKERMRKKDLLEERLQRAKRQRPEYLKKKKSSRCSPHANSNLTFNQAEVLPTKLARCWRRFVKLRGTTYELTKAFESLNINEKSVKQLPFEQLALKIGSDMTLRVVRSLLERLETRLLIQYAVGKSSRTQVENIDHLLKRVASPRRKGRSNFGSRTKSVKKGGSSKEGSQRSKKLSRYQVRILLCAYMILGHPDAVLSRKGENENSLADSAAKLIREFELLVKIILGGSGAEIKSENFSMGTTLTFRRQLDEFDKAWCTYLYHFVVWKVKDAESLEQDLVRAACQLELSMMQTCKLTPEGEQDGLTHGMQFIQKQVIEDQRLLKAKVQNLSGDAGIERLKDALSDTRSTYFASKEIAPVTYITSPSSSGSEDGSPVSISSKISNLAGNEWLGGVARSLFKEEDPSLSKEVFSFSSSASSLDSEPRIGAMPLSENELLVNEIVHVHHHGLPHNLDVIDRGQSGVKEKVKETMEKAYWDAVMDSVQREQPDFSWVLKLTMEVRDELSEISPSSWKQEIIDTIDLDILSQVLGSGMLDMNYLGRILEFALDTLRKLSAPAKEDEMKVAHQNLLRELVEVSQSQSLFAIALVKGLRFVLQQIQALKKEISRARIKLIEPFIRGPAGLEYLQKAFSNRYGPLCNASNSLPLTTRWLSSVKPNSEQEWIEHTESLSTLLTPQASHPQGLPSIALRTGGSISAESNMPSAVTSTTGNEQPECTGERIDLLVRLGLLKLVCAIEGLTLEDLPETLKLNLTRLRSVQHQLQKIIVISTSMLVLRQTLVSEKLASALEMESIICECTKRLSELLDTVEDVGISEIVSAIFKPSEDGSNNLVPDPEKWESVKGMAANVLAKSLQSGDAIFTQVSRVIYLGLRGLILGGTGSKGRELAKCALQRIGAASLADKVVEAVEVLITVATVSMSVHRAWYDELVNKM